MKGVHKGDRPGWGTSGQHDEDDERSYVEVGL